MSITVNNGVANIKGTPGIIQDSFVNIPAAVDVANGTIFIDTVSLNILINLNGVWTLLYAPGGIPNLQQVLDSGNTAINQDMILSDSSNNVASIYPYNIICEKTGNAVTEHYSNGIDTTDLITNIKTSYKANFINFQDLISLNIQQLYPNQTFANQKTYLPENDGILALQNPPFISTINTAAVTVNGTKNGIYRVATGAVTVTLQPSNWVDRKTLTFCVESSFTFVATGGATIKGIAFVNKTGLFYATYLQSFNTFYISHV